LPVIDTLIVMKQRFGGSATPIGARLSRVFTADRRHIHHILVARYGSPGKAILGIWSVTLLFAAAAVMTALEGMRRFGYIAAGTALLALFVLRYRPRRAEPKG
jgi:hypothetical protein